MLVNQHSLEGSDFLSTDFVGLTIPRSCAVRQ